MQRFFYFLCLGLTACSLANLTSCDKPHFIDLPVRKDYKAVTPKEIGMKERNVAEAVRFAESLPLLKAVIIGYDDQIFIQRYLHGYNGKDLINFKSVSKVFLSIAVGILVDEKKITSLDEPIEKFLPAYAAQFAKDEQKKTITLRHIMTMSSGLKKLWTFKEIPKDQSDWVKYILEQPMDFSPGDKFEYNCVNSHVLIAILENILKQDVYAFIKERVLNPLGFRGSRWEKDPSGRYIGGSDFFVHPADLAKVVKLYFDNGMIGDKRLLSEEWVKDSTNTQVQNPESSFLNFGYGYHWWTAGSGSEGAAFFENGLGGQMLHATKNYKSFLILAFEVTAESEGKFEEQQSNVANFFQLLYN